MTRALGNSRLTMQHLLLCLFCLALAHACVVNPVPTPGTGSGATTANEFNDAAKDDVYSPTKTSDVGTISDSGQRSGGSADAMAADVLPADDVANTEDSDKVTDLSTAPTADSADAANLPSDTTVQAD